MKKVVIVTGGTSGIGEGCVRHYAELGAKVREDRDDSPDPGVELLLLRHRQRCGGCRPLPASFPTSARARQETRLDGGTERPAA